MQRENTQLPEQRARAELLIDIQKTFRAAGHFFDSPDWRAHVTTVLATHAATFGIPTLSAALAMPRATAYPWQRPASPFPERVRVPSPRALTLREQAHVLAQLHAARFVGRSPAQVYATLLEEKTYLCSPRTMYRILKPQHEVRERRSQRTHPRTRCRD